MPSRIDMRMHRAVDKAEQRVVSIDMLIAKISALLSSGTQADLIAADGWMTVLYGMWDDLAPLTRELADSMAKQIKAGLAA